MSGRGTKRSRNNNSRNQNPRQPKRSRNINANANNRIAGKRHLVLNRAVLRSQVYQALLPHYRHLQYTNITAAVNRALARAGL